MKAKFVQIAVLETRTGNEAVYALDAIGGVWRLILGTDVEWQSMTGKRNMRPKK
jgi:hypothetical protein